MGREREVIQPQQSQSQQTVSFTVEQLVAVNPYNPDILPDLENYVNEQVSILS
jgi:translation initiation factor 3 subunit K